MANDSASPDTLIAGRYAVDPFRPRADAGGGLAAYLATDRQGGEASLVALAVDRYASPRRSALLALERAIDNLMVPVAHGIAAAPGSGQGYYVVCSSPPGPPLSAGQEPWPEPMLMEHVLKPAAQVLVTLQALGLTHRAIRPNNVFVAGRAQPVTLGAAWAAPPAMHQPAVFESPYSAMCHPAGRGDGSIADDVYALGVLLITLAIGRAPMAGMDDATVVRRKLELGNYGALTAGAPIPAFMADLLRGMLAEDPDHRPSPRLLIDPANTRARRVAARPPRRAQRPLMLNDIAVYDARTLAYALSTDERKAIQALRNGAATQWLRRMLGDGGLAALIEDLVRVRLADTRSAIEGDALLLMHTISTIEPRMPLCWRGIMLWPDALGSFLAEGVRAEPDLMALTEELIRNDIAQIWALGAAREQEGEPVTLSYEERQQRQFLQRGGEGGLLRLFYGMNPLLPCAVPTGGAWIATVSDLMRYLEATAAPSASLIDPHIMAFIAARGGRQGEETVNGLIAAKDPDIYRMKLLGLLRDLQRRYHPKPMPALASWAAAQLRPALEQWHNQPRRLALIEQLDELAQAGSITRLLALIDDPKARAEDRDGALRAAMTVQAIDAELAAIAQSGEARAVHAERFGRESAAAVGMTALILMILVTLLQ